MDKKIIAKLKQREKESEFHNRCIKQNICPYCGGNLIQDSDIGTFVEIQCDGCDYEFVRSNSLYVC
jgi:hypothetical protein